MRLRQQPWPGYLGTGFNQQLFDPANWIPNQTPSISWVARRTLRFLGPRSPSWPSCAILALSKSTPLPPCGQSENSDVIRLKQNGPVLEIHLPPCDIVSQFTTCRNVTLSLVPKPVQQRPSPPMNHLLGTGRQHQVQIRHHRWILEPDVRARPSDQAEEGRTECAAEACHRGEKRK